MLSAADLPVTEADLAMEFYFHARSRGIQLRGEVKVPSTLHRSGLMRCDFAMVNEGWIVALIEVKAPGSKIGGNTRQKHAYGALKPRHGIPTFWLSDSKRIESIVDALLVIKSRGAGCAPT